MSFFRISQAVYRKTSSLLLWMGALNGLAILNITDRETWKAYDKVLVGLVFLAVTLPLLPFLALGLGMIMLGDKLDAH